MSDYWAWGGKYIGFSISNYLYSRKGHPIGYFSNNILYDFSGRHLADVQNSNKLITVISHKTMRNVNLCKPANVSGRNYANHIGNIMIAGCEDFYFDE